MLESDYVSDLENTVRAFLKPLKNLPFPVVIKALTGCQVLPFTKSDTVAGEFLEKLSQAAALAGENAFKDGIFTARPNEAGNQIEPFVLYALRQIGIKAFTPLTKAGKKKTAGYPDILVIYPKLSPVYLDCKTYNILTKEQSFRTFYFSPSDNPKITTDGYHLLLSFELDRAERKGRMAFVPKNWQIYTLDKLAVNLKHEFNASNKVLYNPKALLSQER